MGAADRGFEALDVVVLRVDSSGAARLDWGGRDVSFQLAHRGGAVFEWFAEVTEIDPSGPHGFLWEVRGWVEAPCAMAAWAPLLPLLLAPRPVAGCSPDPGLRVGLGQGAVRRSTVTPAVVRVGEVELLCRSVSVETSPGPTVLQLVPLRGHPIAVEADGDADDADGLMTQFGPVTISGVEPTIARLSRFPELWSSASLTELVRPSEAAGPALLSALSEGWRPTRPDPERLELLLPPADAPQRNLLVRHVVSGPEGEMTTLLRRDEKAIAEALQAGEVWRPIVARAVTEVVWIDSMLEADLVALAADPTPAWRSMPAEVRHGISARLLELVESELAGVGCLVPWIDPGSDADPLDRRRRRLRSWLDAIDPEDNFDGFLMDDDGSRHDVMEDGDDYSLAVVIEAALRLQLDPELAGVLPSPLRVLKLISWLLGRIDDEQWEFDLDAARERQADDYFDVGQFRDLGDYEMDIIRSRWFAQWPDDDQDPEG